MFRTALGTAAHSLLIAPPRTLAYMQAPGQSWNEVKVRLLNRREELAQRLASVKADLAREGEPLSPDFAEQAGQREHDEVLSALRASTELELCELDIALTRLRAGKYGECSRCGYPIEPKRLDAVPYTDCCSLCAPQTR